MESPSITVPVPGGPAKGCLVLNSIPFQRGKGFELLLCLLLGPLQG